MPMHRNARRNIFYALVYGLGWIFIFAAIVFSIQDPCESIACTQPLNTVLPGFCAMENGTYAPCTRGQCCCESNLANETCLAEPSQGARIFTTWPGKVFFLSGMTFNTLALVVVFLIILDSPTNEEEDTPTRPTSGPDVVRQSLNLSDEDLELALVEPDL